ncbi:MAG: hypothetical protein FK734_08480 [Asgard group archaeon]|nr:hypothetical protein [Asgard group archaeon]
MVISINSDDKKQDAVLFSFLIVGILLTSLVWVGDIASWGIVGNGFIIDIIVLIVAILLTIGLVFLGKKYRERKAARASAINETASIVFDNKPEPKIESIPPPTRDLYLTCPNCGEVIPIDADNCSSCGSPKPVCIVCFSPLKADEKIVKTPCCSTYAHYDHLVNLLAIKGFCPQCNSKLAKEQLIEL